MYVNHIYELQPPGKASRIAVIGAGISGLGAAWLLSKRYNVTLFEAQSYAGGHAHTVDITLQGVTSPVDTGFLVFNRRTYPNLCGLFEALDVPLAKSSMSFAVSLEEDEIEWAGSSLFTLFAQKRNLLRAGYWKMLADIRNFNAEATLLALENRSPKLSLGEFIKKQGYGENFCRWYLLPMISAIWSCPFKDALAYPLPVFLHFFHNHGLLQLSNRPQWLTVAGGSREYVRRMVQTIPDIRLSSPVNAVSRQNDYVEITTAKGVERFDQVVFACHTEQILAILQEEATPEERAVFGSIRYQKNLAILHTDSSLLPKNHGIWSSWNFTAKSARQMLESDQPVSVSYLINKLQPLPFEQPVIVTLNPWKPPQQEHVLDEFDYAHPVFEKASIDAQAHLAMLQGNRRSWFCGAWSRYGFHEDGLRSAVEISAMMGVVAPWSADPLPMPSFEEQIPS